MPRLQSDIDIRSSTPDIKQMPFISSASGNASANPGRGLYYACSTVSDALLNGVIPFSGLAPLLSSQALTHGDILSIAGPGDALNDTDAVDVK